MEPTKNTPTPTKPEIKMNPDQAVHKFYGSDGDEKDEESRSAAPTGPAATSARGGAGGPSDSVMQVGGGGAGTGHVVVPVAPIGGNNIAAAQPVAINPDVLTADQRKKCAALGALLLLAAASTTFAGASMIMNGGVGVDAVFFILLSSCCCCLGAAYECCAIAGTDLGMGRDMRNFPIIGRAPNVAQVAPAPNPQEVQEELGTGHAPVIPEAEQVTGEPEMKGAASEQVTVPVDTPSVAPRVAPRVANDFRNNAPGRTLADRGSDRHSH